LPLPESPAFRRGEAQISEQPSVVNLLKDTIDLLQYELNEENYELHIFMNHDPEFYDPYLRINILRDYMPEYKDHNSWTDRVQSKITCYLRKQYNFTRNGMHEIHIGDSLTQAGKEKWNTEQAELEKAAAKKE
jgi:hypothetical protein